MKHLDITISGLVQGVFFRASTVEKAKQLGIRGWVCNLSDGKVYLEAEGQQPQLKIFIEWLHQGPDTAKVSDVNISEGKIREFTNFEIRRA